MKPASIILTTVVLFFTLLANRSWSGANPCSDSSHSSNNVNILIIDMTTELNDFSKSKLDAGIHRIVMRNDVNGILQVYLVGPKDYTIELIYENCLPAFHSGAKANGDNANKKSILERIIENIIPSASNRDKVKTNDSSNVVSIRTEINKAITNKAYSHGKKCDSTCLLNDIIHVISDRRPGYAQINVFCFTDLEDSKLSRMIKNNIPDDQWQKEAMKDSQKYKIHTEKLNPRKESIVFEFWGCGRSEDIKQGTLDKTNVDKLKKYWSTFLNNSLGEHFSNIVVNFYLDYPRY